VAARGVRGAPAAEPALGRVRHAAGARRAHLVRRALVVVHHRRREVPRALRRVVRGVGAGGVGARPLLLGALLRREAVEAQERARGASGGGRVDGPGGRAGRALAVARARVASRRIPGGHPRRAERREGPADSRTQRRRASARRDPATELFVLGAAENRRENPREIDASADPPSWRTDESIHSEVLNCDCLLVRSFFVTRIS
jgi:hypothetical protein